ncbi:KaiA family protein [Cronbergia sp. UHCC 0137]|uniref:KaiA family protein n=1 Tax=Cronbergia sp. UHCC 0137 TaxID=3110239 RepID=UPI002B2165EE|nr:KaiA family protein [Cronbergia sp. UHCC 0137]MEA5617835.1 KaiA family protein [Cronbergia sp. UHCC 0137]
MLIPLLILPANIEKYLDKSGKLSNARSLFTQIHNLADSIIAQLFCLQLIHPIPITTHNIPKSTLELQNSNLFACHKPKNQQQFQQMNPADQQEILEQIKSEYRQILINYFITDKTLKIKIDNFINTLFYASVPVPTIIEIHMEVIDEFSTQLKLEGRSNETLLDYRLTLIDILANLCEVYRRSMAKIS